MLVSFFLNFSLYSVNSRLENPILFLFIYAHLSLCQVLLCYISLSSHQELVSDVEIELMFLNLSTEGMSKMTKPLQSMLKLPSNVCQDFWHLPSWVGVSIKVSLYWNMGLPVSQVSICNFCWYPIKLIFVGSFDKCLLILTRFNFRPIIVDTEPMCWLTYCLLWIRSFVFILKCFPKDGTN